MSVDWLPLRERAAVHAALGEPARLAVVEQLLLGDRSPAELGAALGLASNLLAHHLRVLEQAGVVARGRSEADRRRTYLRLAPAAVTGLVNGLVPDAALAAGRVVFVGTHNSARSQLAAALWARRSAVAVASAGTEPAARVHRQAVAVARRHGLDLRGAGTARVSDVVGPGDLVVAVCDRAYEDVGGRLHWSVPDPVREGAAGAFERVFGQLAERVERLSAAVHPVGAGSGAVSRPDGRG
jgi:protein-tyrosine-phosphatase